MQSPLTSRRTPVGFNMTPMIDVVFLLIIFFLVSSHLAQRENRIRVDLPSAVSGQTDPAQASPRLTLTLERDGTLWLAGQRMETDQLAARLDELRQEHGEGVELRVRCDRSLPYRDVEPILQGAVQASVWKVSFAVFDQVKSES